MTFNHAAYIEEALHGIDMQQTNFDFEVVVGDDFSTDNTLSIIKNYSFTNPKIELKILNREIGGTYHAKRLKKGRLYNFVDILNNCQGKYIALLDGDDYWFDPFKLQKQVDFLENNEHYVIHSTNAIQLQNGVEKEKILKVSSDEIFQLKDLLVGNKIITPTVLFRNLHLKIDSKFLEVSFGDWFLYVLLTHTSGKKIYRSFDNTSIYRVHVNGIMSQLNEIDYNKNHVSQIIAINKYLKKTKLNNIQVRSINKYCISNFELFLKKNSYMDAIICFVINFKLTIGYMPLKEYFNLSREYFLQKV